MKLVVRNIFIIAVMPLVLALLSACERTELCYNHYPQAAVTFDWEQEWERDYGTALPDHWNTGFYGFEYDFLRPGVPEWVNLVKYRDNAPDGEQYFSPVGDNVVLKEKGVRSFLFYNGDTEYIVLSDIASLPNARASATPRSRGSIAYLMERHPDTRSANPPDVLYSAFVESVPNVAVHEVWPLPVKMQPLVFTYVVRYEFEYGLQHVRLARGALAGMAESVYLRDGRTSDEAIIVLYDCEVTDYGCEARVRSFGVPGFPDEYYGRTGDADVQERPYTLNLEVLLTNGKTLEFNYDVAEQLKNQPRGGVINISGIRIEDEQNEPSSDSGGFDVDLSGWGEVDVDLPINSN
ncbi:MAG: DUF5119 domain-containing protein [Muribaculaceae bacterium]|nr:DUF5119 domain-containing protein [Muribaculaceae bacterium]